MSSQFQRWDNLIRTVKAQRDAQKTLKQTPPRTKQQEPKTHEQREKAKNSAVSAMR